MRLTSESEDAYFAANHAAWLAAIVESSDDAIIGKTLDSVIRSWNATATRMFGYSREEAIGRSVLMLIPPELQDEERVIVSRLARGERVTHFETTRVRKDGARIDVSLSVSPILSADGKVLGAAKIARDITESNRLRKVERALSADLQDQAVEMEQQAVELEQQVEEAQSLQEELEQTNDELYRVLEEAQLARKQADHANLAKSQFLATMSHELRTPLNAIGGYVDLLELGVRGPLSAPQLQDLSRIKRNQETLLRLIDEVLDFAKLEAGRLELRPGTIVIDDVLRTMRTFVAPNLVRNHIQFACEACGPDLTAYADQHRVEQIMLNLVSNAVKFTDHGSVTVRCRRAPAQVHIDVTDTGRGVPPDMLEKIFEPFVQGEQDLTRTAQGTGLGLSISRQLARQMGGDVVARSEPGCGSTFTLTLPRTAVL